VVCISQIMVYTMVYTMVSIIEYTIKRRVVYTSIYTMIHSKVYTIIYTMVYTIIYTMVYIYMVYTMIVMVYTMVYIYGIYHDIYPLPLLYIPWYIPKVVYTTFGVVYTMRQPSRWVPVTESASGCFKLVIAFVATVAAAGPAPSD
jgi:hypothetical protein